MTKFVSKNANLGITLESGFPEQRLTGIPRKPGLYAKFSGGVLIQNDEKVIEKLRAHPGFGVDYIEIEEGQIDPFAHNRREPEPEHNVANIDYGQLGKNQNPKPKMVLSFEQKQIVAEMAKEMAKGMVKEALKEMMEEQTRKKEAPVLPPQGNVADSNNDDTGKTKESTEIKGKAVSVSDEAFINKLKSNSNSKNNK